MSFLLDTNVVSEIVKKEPAPAVLAWFKHNQTHCYLSAVTVAEIELGVELLPTGQRRQRLSEALQDFFQLFEDRILAFDFRVARQWAKLAALLEKRGRKTPVQDSMIEAIALYWQLTVVSRNTTDFAKAPTLNPWTEA